MIKTSLFKLQRKSLTEEEVINCFKLFVKIAKQKGIAKLHQVKFEESEEKTMISYKFHAKSKSHTVQIPILRMQRTETCQGLEQVTAVEIDLINCGLCKGSGSAIIQAKQIPKLESLLNNAYDILIKEANEAYVEDKQQLDFDKIVKEAEHSMQYTKKITKKGKWSNETSHYLGKVSGSIDAERGTKTFEVTFNSLSLEQVKKLGKIVPNL